MWMRLWSSARYDLGLKDKEFFALTPRKFDALQKRHKYKVESEQLLFAQLTYWVANTGFKSPNKPTTMDDFMPSRWGKKAAEEEKKVIKRRKRAVIASEIRSIMSFFPRITASK